MSAAARALPFALAAALGASACAERFGKRAVAGAAEGMRQQRANNPDERPVRQVSQQAMEGALESLDTPEQRERIQSLVALAVSEAARVAVRDATRELILELGPDGRGQLAMSVAGTGEQATRAALVGARQGLAEALPACAGRDPFECLQAHLHDLARSSAVGFTSGLRETLGWPLLLLAFAVGVVGGVLGSWLWSLRGLAAARQITKPA